jgi:hypothetical protein
VTVLEVEEEEEERGGKSKNRHKMTTTYADEVRETMIVLVMDTLLLL